MDGGRGLRILVVCTANICRSPMAEHLFRRGAEQRGVALEVSSAGFLFDGEEASPKTISVMSERGFDLRDHRSRTVTPALLAEADLVVTMERRHARDLIVDHPDLADRVHTLGGVVEILADFEPEADTSPAERIAMATGYRSSAQLLSTGPDEVSDPHGRSRRRHRLAADRIALLVDALLDVLYGPPGD